MESRQPLEHLRCVVERITYQSEGYSVLKCAARNYSDLVTVVGTMPDAHVGSVLSLGGRWKIDSRYGRQFQVATFEETLPATVYGMEKYLGSGLIRGIGPKYAKKIVQTFGADTLEIIEHEPDRLLEVPNIGAKRVESIKKSWLEQKEIKNIMLFLQGHDVSTSHATKIYKQYGADSIQVVQENPYRLADDIWGIGFRTADTIAAKMGFEKEKFVRLRSGIMYTLNRLAEEGHCYATREQLLETGSQLLEVDPALLSMTLDEMVRTRDVITAPIPAEESLPGAGATERSGTLAEDPAAGMTAAGNAVTAGSASDGRNAAEDGPGAAGKGPGAGPDSDGTQHGIDPKRTAIYLPPFFFSEIGVERRLRKIRETPAARGLREEITPYGTVEYDEVQREAIRTAMHSKMMILTGGPGTGKSTTTLGILHAWRQSGLRVLLAAPTGRAAKRLSEVTGMEAKTIHRLLEYKPPEGYQRNEENPLEGDALIVDECSMVDLMLMYNLLTAVPDSMRLVLVGDVDQLPSVGAGNVLRDMIGSGAFEVVRLQRIFRQAASSRIITKAHRINQGEFPDLRNAPGTDFFFQEVENPEEAARIIVHLVQTRLPGYFHVPPAVIQVLTPMQRGVIGATNLNQALQAALNPATGGPELHRGGYAFRTGDKVMQIRNDYDKEVFNGDIGTVEQIDLEERTLRIRFDDRLVSYDVSELDEVVLAYATTIHKAQGAEYPIVVMPIMMSHYMMLQRNLLYTGVTRAKRALMLVGTKKAIGYCVRNLTVDQRNTLLAERLEGKV